MRELFNFYSPRNPPSPQRRKQNLFNSNSRIFGYIKVYILWRFSKLPIDRHKHSPKYSQMVKNTLQKSHNFISRELQLITVLYLIRNSYMSEAQGLCLFQGKCGIFYFWSHFIFIKFSFVFSKNMDSLTLKHNSLQNSLLWKTHAENMQQKLVPNLFIILVNTPKQPLYARNSFKSKIFWKRIIKKP